MEQFADLAQILKPTEQLPNGLVRLMRMTRSAHGPLV